MLLIIFVKELISHNSFFILSKLQPFLYNYTLQTLNQQDMNYIFHFAIKHKKSFNGWMVRFSFKYYRPPVTGIPYTVLQQGSDNFMLKISMRF